MNIRTTEKEGTHVVEIEGKLDSSASTSVEVYLEGLLGEGAKRIVIDLGKLDFISSSGLRVLLATAKRIKAGGGELSVCSLNKTVQEVFEISGFVSLMRVFASAKEALESS